MFQYAAGLALAEHHRTVLKIDPSWFHFDSLQEKHNKYSLNCFNIVEQFATQEEVQRIKGMTLSRADRMLQAAAVRLRLTAIKNLYADSGNYHIADDSRLNPRFLDLSNNTYLQGLWQSEAYFKSAEAALRLHFTFRFPASPAVMKVAEAIANSERAVAVHFRRGDYGRTAEYFNKIKKLPRHEFKMKELEWLEKIGPNLPLSLEYYERSIDYLREKHDDLTLFVFSDDISAISKEFRPNCKHHFVEGDFHAHDTMRLMSLCHDNIIANSSFSWWAAWLNSCVSKTVIAPVPWNHNTSSSDEFIVPENWVRLPTGFIN